MREITAKLTEEHNDLLNTYDQNIELAQTLYERYCVYIVVKLIIINNCIIEPKRSNPKHPLFWLS